MGVAEKAARHYQRGLESYRAGRLDAAARDMRRAVDLDPANADRRYDLAVVLQEQGKHADAAAEYQRVLRTRGEAVDALSNLALCLLKLGRLEEAEYVARRAVALAPDSAAALHNLGLVEDAAGRDSAVATLRRADALRPDSPAILNALGVALDRTGDLHGAEACFRKALGLDPDLRAARENLGSVLFAMGRLAEAEAASRELLARDPASGEGHFRLAFSLLLASRAPEALDVVQRGIERSPDAKLWNLLGQIFRDLGEPERAIPAIREALRLDPDFADASLHLATVLLSLERFRDGWAAFRLRPRKPQLPGAATVPALRRADLDDLSSKRVLVRGEQGLGDELFFLRFAPQLREREATLVYMGDGRLARMLAAARAVDEFVGSASPTPSADYFVLAGDLPDILGDEEAVRRPAPVALLPEGVRVERLRARLSAAGPAPYIGVTWQAGVAANRWEVEQKAALFKRVPPGALGAALGEVPGTVVVVQRESQESDLAAFSRGLGRPAVDLSSLGVDLEDALALMALLDEYVGVSNTNMHLRAGVGRPGRVLVQLPAEWRWGAAGMRSPWFPGFTLYRETAAGGWEGALDRLRGDLQAALRLAPGPGERAMS